MERELIAGFFGLDVTSYSSFDFGCVVGYEPAENLFHRLIKDNNITTILIHNKFEKGHTIESSAVYYLEPLGNQELSLQLPDHGGIMSYNAYFELGCIFFNRESTSMLKPYHDILSEARSCVYDLIEFHSEHNAANKRVLEVWERLKTVEDENLIRAGIIL